MKILFTNENYEEMIINLLIYYRNATCFKRKGNALNMNDIIYRFIVNSCVIDNRIRTVLLSHLNGDYNNAYEVLICQSDVISEFNDNLIKVLLEVEYLRYLKYIYCIYEYTNDPDNSLRNDNYFENCRTSFIKKRSKAIKFFNIDILSIIKRIDSFNFSYLIDHENYLYNTIVDLLNVCFYNIGLSRI